MKEVARDGGFFRWRSYYEALAKSYDYHGFDKKILEAAMEFSDFKPWER